MTLPCALEEKLADRGDGTVFVAWAQEWPLALIPKPSSCVSLAFSGSRVNLD